MQTKALLLAAGSGKRLFPLSDGISKPMFQIFDRPIIGQIIKGLKNAGISNIYVVSRPNDSFMHEYVKKLGCKIIVQEKPEGTAKAVELAKEYINGNFIIAAGDHFLDLEIYKELSSYELDNVLVAKYIEGDVKNFGLLEIKCGIVKNIIEKPENINEGFINLLIIKTNDAIFDKIKDVKISKRGEYEIVDVLNNFYAHITLRRWFDIGWPWAILDLLHAFEEYVKIDEKCELQNASIKNSYVGKNCIIKNSIIENAMICDNCVINNSYISNSYIMQNAKIVSSNLKNSFIGMNAEIKNVNTNPVINEIAILDKIIRPKIPIGLISGSNKILNAGNFSCHVV
ncbi:MAG: sugar phosphate nucleotidyltransferase [Candidatus Anstonellales archaeon]